jgi:hypothetical protein
VLSNGSCVPCQAGCDVCSNIDFSICLSCLQGYYANSTGGCSMCSTNCMSCTSLGCTACFVSYFLSSNLTCVDLCDYPCTVCNSSNVEYCSSCIYGYTLMDALCIPNILCILYNNCTYCPLSGVLIQDNTLTSINQSCIVCN